MTDWALLVGETAPILAAVSAILIYGADRIIILWNWLTARDRRLAGLKRMDSNIQTLLNELRAGDPNSRWTYLSLVQYGAPSAILLITERLPGGMNIAVEIEGLALYLLVAAILIVHWSRVTVPKIFTSATDVVSWSKVRLRYAYTRTFWLAFVASGTGSLSAILGNPRGILNEPITTTAVAFGLLGYATFVFFRATGNGLATIEAYSYSVKIRATGNAPQCKVWLTKKARATSREIEGTVDGIGDVLTVRGADDFVEEVEWNQVSAMALRQPSPKSTPT